MSISRRYFLRNTALVTTGIGITAAVPMEVLAKLRKTVSPADKINVGLIGCKGQGWSNLTSMLKIPQVNCLGICDIDDNILNARKADLEKINIRPTIYKDYRKLLENKDIHVVIIATPDHWHCLQMIEACAAGKDVFTEKPLSNSIIEAQLMVKAANKYNRMVQVAQWQRSHDHFKNAIAFVQSGKLGKITLAKTWMCRGGTTPLVPVPNEPIPAGVDYEKWLGPAPKKPFNKNRFHYEFRWFWDYAGGLMTDWGVHLIDMVLLGMNVDAPKSIVASGGKFVFPDDARETPDTQTVIYDYGNFQMTWEHTMGFANGNYGLGHGIAFLGEKGTLLLNRSGWEVRPEKERDALKMEAVAWQARTDNGLDKHTANFIAVVQSRKKADLNCSIEQGARVAINSHMGNIAQRTGEKIFWDSSKNKFNSSKANALLVPEYHNGYKLPKM
ncbi:MAG: Gfo/Idh/MocA family protein [Flavisolibacter sp.]